MSTLVPASQIEKIVGIKRDKILHYGRMVSDEDTDTIYILHSQDCVDSTGDLRDCPFPRGFALSWDCETAMFHLLGDGSERWEFAQEESDIWDEKFLAVERAFQRARENNG